jgi:acyl-CoA thioester hydrolase
MLRPGNPASMPSEFRIARTVEFSETDMAGIMHFSNFFRWMEACEAAFYRSLNLPLISFVPGSVVGWPRVKASCDYKAPLRFNDNIEVRLLVREVRTRAVIFVFQFRKVDVAGQVLPDIMAQGEIAAVCVTSDPAGKMVAQPIPPDVRAKLEVAPESAWVS